MALNMTSMTRAPMYDYQVFMVRNKSLNAVENNRKRMVYVKASNEADAKREAKRQWPEFHAESASKV